LSKKPEMILSISLHGFEKVVLLIFDVEFAHKRQVQ